MAFDFDEFLETTQAVTDVTALNASFYRAVAAEGYENLVFVQTGGHRPMEVLSTELPPGYAEAYYANKWALIDPVLRRSQMTRQPFSWASLSQEAGETPVETQFYAACRAIGVHSGVTMPFHNPGGRTHLVSVSLRGNDRPDLSRVPYLYALSAQTWIRHNALVAEPPDTTQIVLTGRERECLLWAKDGKTNWEISRILAVAERTVEFHIANVMRKLDATNRVTAIVIALQRGLIRM